MVWLDRNKDGLKDPDEPYLPNIEVTLLPANAPSGTEGTKIKTDINGQYQFLSLAPGDYKVVTTIPSEMYVTYDSEGLHQGEINTTLPSGGKSFTYAGLVASSEVVDKQTMEILLTNNPKAIPLEEVPAWLKAKVQSLLNPEKFNQPKKDEQLAETGSNALMLAAFGALLLFTGVVIRRLTRTKRRSAQY